MAGLTAALFLVVGLIVAFAAHEYAHARVASALGDATPRIAGRLTLDPRPHIDTFGSLVLPGILLLPPLFGRMLFPIFAYGKPLNLRLWEPGAEARPAILAAMAGPAANLALAILFGALLRVSPGRGAVTELLAAGLNVNVTFTAMNLIPIPPLDASRLLVRALPPRAAELYRSWESYGALFILAIFFILPGPVFAFVSAVGNGICRLAAGFSCI